MIDTPRPSFKRPPIERYVRCMIELGESVTIEPGLQYHRGELIGELTIQLRDVVEPALHRPVRDLQLINTCVEDAITRTWPDRAWFVEVHHVEGWTQIFQPFGVPMNLAA